MSARCWASQLDALAGGLSALAVDLPGHGESDPSDASSVEEYARAVLGALDALGTGPVIAAGHSLGGAVAIALAAARPEAVLGLVLLSSCDRNPHPDGAAERILGSLPAPLRRLVVFSMAKKMLFAHGAPARAVSLGIDELRACRPETMQRDMRAAKAMALGDSAARLDVPTLILCGSRDTLTPPAMSERLAGLISGSRLRIVEGAGHMLPLEDPERVNREILEFAGALGAPSFEAPAVQATPKRSLLRRVLDRLSLWAGSASGARPRRRPPR